MRRTGRDSDVLEPSRRRHEGQALPAEGPAAGGDGPSARPPGRLRGLVAWRGAPAAALALILVLLLLALSPEVFAPPAFTFFLATYVPAILLALAVTFPLLVGGIDLSVGPVMGLCGILTVLLSSVGLKLLELGPSGVATTCVGVGVCEQGLPFGVVVALVIAFGMAFGLLNGIAVAVLRLQPLVATLAAGFVAAGLGLYLFPQPGGQMPSGPVTLYSTPAYLSAPMIAVLVATGIALLIMKTPLGVRMRAAGSNPWKAFASGVPVRGTVIAAYVISGAFAAVAGVLFTLNVASADPTVGVTFTLLAIAAAVLGGTALRGGWAEPFGPALGALTLGFLAQLVSVLEVPMYYTQFVTGALILLGLAVTQTSLRLTRGTR